MIGKTIDTAALLNDAARRSIRYAEAAGRRSVTPDSQSIARLSELGGPLPDGPADPTSVLALLDDIGSHATVASTGGRYFGFVTGGSLPATLAANWLAGAWDQNAGPSVCSPTATALEEISVEWVRQALELPPGTGGGLVTGATMANFCGLAAARHALLHAQGWDVQNDGLFGAPPLTLVVGDEVHAALLKALSLLGLGCNRVVRVPTDGQGRMRANALPPLNPSTILCIQAGNVNTGAFDPARPICEAARAAGAWVHVDGAFGLWARAAPRRAALADGLDLAHSWATDGHKWLNVPYDCGIVLVREPVHLESAMSAGGAYLAQGAERHPYRRTPEMSRRARGVEVWAALRSLGRAGLADLVERNCRQARRFADGLRAAGHKVMIEVVLNQVLVAFGNADRTSKVIAAIQNDGICWCGGTAWHGTSAMRISVSSWATTDEDVEQSLAAILRIADKTR